MTQDLRDRVARVEGRIDALEHRTETNTHDIITHGKELKSIREDMGEVTNFLAKATGAFNGAKWALMLVGALISLGIISITFGG